MKGKIGIVLICCLICFGFTNADSPINYQHKSLLRSIKKVGIIDFSALSEIQLNDEQINYVQGKIFSINQENVSQYKYIYVGRVNSCREGGCSAPNVNHVEGKSEYFDYFIIFDQDKTVQLVNVFNYQATHGQEISAKGWLKQFDGHSHDKNLQVGKNIDAISGATISVYAITLNIEVVTGLLNTLDNN